MKGMKYAILCSALSLVFYYHNLMIGGGFWGYMAGIIYLFTYRAHSTLLAIGVAWSMTIIGLTAVLTVVSLLHKIVGKKE